MEGYKMQGSGRRPSHSRSRSISRSLSKAAWHIEHVFGSANQTRRASSRADQDEEALRWAALEKLPTYARLRTSIIQYIAESAGGEHGSDKVVRKEVDVRKLDVNDRQQFIDRLFRVAEEDNERFLRKFRNRIEKGENRTTLLFSPSHSRELHYRSPILRPQTLYLTLQDLANENRSSHNMDLRATRVEARLCFFTANKH
ncbi:hypothetical protein HYC85_028201 [Camellia sinensis]|uniref:ABC-transporter N-terminal domain-containing protein n=1 Tax=Camellia sinensis TaxID=4442 RepID=A0A7J7FUH5_CAMSI|nr:hypothetical protein HYC85_028201 [Camellia sinensis]